MFSVGSANSAIRLTLTSRWCCFLLLHRLPENKTNALPFAQFHELTSETAGIVRMHFSQQGFKRNDSWAHKGPCGPPPPTVTMCDNGYLLSHIFLNLQRELCISDGGVTML